MTIRTQNTALCRLLSHPSAIMGPPEHCTVVGHVVGFDGVAYEIEIEHGEEFHLITFNVKRGDIVLRLPKDITLWTPRG